MTEITKATQIILNMIDMIEKMDGLALSSAARSCRDVKMQNLDAADGMLNFPFSILCLTSPINYCCMGIYIVADGLTSSTTTSWTQKDVRR
jgi:hypothetical protein